MGMSNCIKVAQSDDSGEPAALAAGDCRIAPYGGFVSLTEADNSNFADMGLVRKGGQFRRPLGKRAA